MPDGTLLVSHHKQQLHVGLQLLEAFWRRQPAY